jgi:signal transduction histidine kinase
MSGVAAPVTGEGGSGVRRGLRGSVRALPRALALLGLTLAGAVLLVLAVGPVVLAALGFGHLLQDQLNHGVSLGGEATRDLLGGIIGLVCCYLVLPPALLGARWLATLTRELSARWCGVAIASAYQPAPQGPGRLGPGRLGSGRLGYRRTMSWLLNDVATWRDLLWLAVSAVIGWVLPIVPLTLVVVGLVAFIIPALGSIHALGSLDHVVPPPAFPGNSQTVIFLIGAGMVALGAGIAPWMLRGYGGLARLVLAPSEQARLQLRVMHLDRTRQETLEVGAAELRRIERDLHDGAQARLVAMGLTLDAAGRLIETDPAAARALLIEARDASAKALSELRDLVRGIHPPVLADRGLADAVRALALDSPLRVTVTGGLPGRPPAPVESAAYFAVSELLANVAKHSGARAAEVDLRYSADALRIGVADNGSGGVDASRGTGLRGIERRLAAFDGVLAVHSPIGGPTVVTLEVPCALS